ncbi:hypothetical protein BcepIL02_gp12 [Burkholderia phage BcepIL02]|uniref:Uncharacterized protein n=1 Tax=Burkholderia phage BcepIL02 TaxID=2886898 RepID=C5IHK4_9CAUD|nr:hypothetical protein BcepIL02_gp12 [Burkholderia phage BcepIL02]ACR15005.1 hypothetical protein BcepIL02_gp12 [Burkholderia phage BcepIL02]
MLGSFEVAEPGALRFRFENRTIPGGMVRHNAAPCGCQSRLSPPSHSTAATLSRRTAREVRAFVPTGPAFRLLVIRVAGPSGLRCRWSG